MMNVPLPTVTTMLRALTVVRVATLGMPVSFGLNALGLLGIEDLLNAALIAEVLEIGGANLKAVRVPLLFT